MKGKRFLSAMVAWMLCMGSVPITGFAKTDESIVLAPETETDILEEMETTESNREVDSEDPEESIPEELSYHATINEDGAVVFSFDGEDIPVEMNESTEDSHDIGTVATEGSKLNVRTGAGMDYEIIDQLLPGDEVFVVGVEGD